MRLIDLAEKGYTDAGIVAFGFFDCIHLGHQAVIGKAVELARAFGVPASVFLFRNNIYELIGVKKAPLFTFEERLAYIAELGVDQVLFIDADEVFLSLSPQSYVDFLRKRVRVAGCTCGKDFTFGKGGVGTADLLLKLLGGRSEIVDLFIKDGEKVSSEGVKKALEEGDLNRVKSFLGREFALRRTVLPGRKDGGKMGFPTVNTAAEGAKMKQGVYFTTTIFDGRSYPSVTNVGAHPTFGDEVENIETFILDYSGDLYGRTVEITFHAFAREIVRFDSVEALRERIAADVAARRLI